MPVIKSAKKKLRQDKEKEKINNRIRDLFKKAVKKAKQSPTAANIKAAFKIIDKTVKAKIIHKNKAARLKSSLSKLVKKGKKT